MLKNVAIVMPVPNDWESFLTLLGHLDAALKNECRTLCVFAVDDGSTEPLPPRVTQSLQAITRIEIVELATNLGHQRAIAVGLVEAELYDFDNVVVMDATDRIGLKVFARDWTGDGVGERADRINDDDNRGGRDRAATRFERSCAHCVDHCGPFPASAGSIFPSLHLG